MTQAEIDMTSQELQDIVTALLMRRNYIETGTVTLSVNDAVASKQHKLIKALEPAQKATVARLEALAEKFLAASSKKAMEEIDKGRPPSGLGSKVDNALKECEKWRLTDEQVEELLK